MSRRRRHRRRRLQRGCQSRWLCRSVVGLVVVVALEDVGRIGCLSLLLTKSLSTESHEPSRVAREIAVVTEDSGQL